MRDTDPSTTYVALVDTTAATVQNVQEMASVWGEIRQEFEDVGATVHDAYAVRGRIDFLVIFEAPASATAFQADVILERHGLSVETMELLDTSSFARLVEDT